MSLPTTKENNMKALNVLKAAEFVKVTDYATEIRCGDLLTVVVSKPYWADESYIDLSFFSYIEYEDGELEFVGMFESHSVGSVRAFRSIMAETANHINKWKEEGRTRFICEPTCEKRRSLYKRFIQKLGCEIVDDDDLCLSFK